MSRSSDTRQRTREAAAQLVAGGKRPHELTVDLIYAEIRQGSRTTINDELKAWKDERTKVDALGADLPPAIAEAMRTLWAAAVDQGEAVFAQRRAELENELASAGEREAAAQQALDVVEAAGREQAVQIQALRAQLVEWPQRLDAEAAAKGEALVQIDRLHQELTRLRIDSAQQLDALRQEHREKVADFQATIAQRDAAFRQELDTTTQRLESAQTHMLRQIDDARQGQRKAEAHASKLQQQIGQLQHELTEQRLHSSQQARELAHRDTAVQTLSTEKAALMTEREGQTAQLAAAHGRLEGLQKALDAQEARALAAEAQVATLTAERVAKAVRKERRGEAHD